MAEAHLVPAAALERELEIRKSRFIARASRIETREQAMAFLERARRDHPGAGHHCWAYLIGSPSSASAAMNDDGEPSGTAGKPILSVIQHKGIGDVMVVVIRYFGGIKLGAGGLVRAYAGATERVLSELPLTRREPVGEATLTMGFACEQAVRHWADGHQATVQQVDYGETVTMRMTLPERFVDELGAFCAGQEIHLSLPPGGA